MVWRNNCAHCDVNLNGYGSLNSEYEDEDISSEQLEISTESELSECSSVFKIEYYSSRKARKKAVRQEIRNKFQTRTCVAEYRKAALTR